MFSSCVFIHTHTHTLSHTYVIIHTPPPHIFRNLSVKIHRSDRRMKAFTFQDKGKDSIFVKKSRLIGVWTPRVSPPAPVSSARRQPSCSRTCSLLVSAWKLPNCPRPQETVVPGAAVRAPFSRPPQIHPSRYIHTLTPTPSQTTFNKR